MERVRGEAGGVVSVGGIASPTSSSCNLNLAASMGFKVSPFKNSRDDAMRSLFVAICAR